MHYIHFILVGFSVCSSTQAIVIFHSGFDEASLGAIAGLNIDKSSTTGIDSGTVILDTVNQELDMTANSAHLWGAREGALIAWTQLGDPDLSQHFDNTTVGLFIKSHNNNTEVSTQFDYLTVDVAPAEGNIDLQIQSFDYDSDTEVITLTRSSSAGATYGVFYSTDLLTFEFDIDDSFPSEGAGTTSLTFANPEIAASKLFFEVVEN